MENCGVFALQKRFLVRLRLTLIHATRWHTIILNFQFSIFNSLRCLWLNVSSIKNKVAPKMRRKPKQASSHLWCYFSRQQGRGALHLWLQNCKVRPPPLTFTRFCNKCAIKPFTLLSTENKCKGLLLYSIVLTTLDNILPILFVPYCEFGFLRNLFDKNKYLHIIPVESVVLAVCSQSN